VRDGRLVGVVIGAGALAGAAVLILTARRASGASFGSPREREFFPSLPEPPRTSSGPLMKFPPLVERWRGEVARRAKDLPVGGLLEWIQVESGGDMDPPGGLPSEAGIWQLMFPDDARYGATLEGLRSIAIRSRTQNPADISWLSDRDLDMQVGAGIRKVLAARDDVRRVFAQNGVTWPETSFDFGSAVKQIHATPAVITELVPKITRQGGPLASWDDLHRRVMAFPVSQMGLGLQRLWNTPSRHGFRNRLEDTLHNAEIVGRAWAASSRDPHVTLDIGPVAVAPSKSTARSAGLSAWGSYA
jgi:hypothetical protein